MNSLSTLRITLAALACLWACSDPNSGEIHQGTASDGASEFDAGLGDAQDNDAQTSADTTGADSAAADAKPIDAAAPDSSPADGVITPDAVPDAIADANSDTAVAPDAGADAAIPACCGPSAACPAGWTCNRSDNMGECVAPPPSGKCWTAADCPKGVACAGAFACPCNADCGAPGNQLGQCQGGPAGCCTSDFGCAKGERCVGLGGGGVGVCKPVPAWGGCWDGNDCSPSQKCQGGQVCGCAMDCGVPDKLGQCAGSDSGCCSGALVCPAGQQCLPLSGIGWSTCVAKPAPGQCWKNADCPSGQSCHGAAFCPCNSDCDMPYQGPGICVPPAPACAPIQLGWVKEICNAKGLVVWDGSKCVATCPGCCGCEPFCDKTFATMAECQASCKTCPVWNGACDDALPAQPWWARMASGCVAVSSCLNPGTPGTYATQKACVEACP